MPPQTVIPRAGEQEQIATPGPSRSTAKKPKRKRMFLKFLGYSTLTGFVLAGLFAIWFFLTPSGTKLRNLMADSILTTQHRDWAKYLIGTSEMNRRIDAYWTRFDQYAEETITVQASLPPVEEVKLKPLTEVEAIEGKGFKGWLLSVSDPTKLRIVVPDKYGKGEKVTSMVKRTGALAGVNAGGFVDPEWMGNGFQPTGIVMSGGKIYYRDTGMDTANHIVGIDKQGKMIAGKYTPNELLKMGMSEAVTFSPRFIVNGVGQIKNAQEGWGIAPRTSMAQKEDGTIMFAIIDGRQTHSIGATLYDIQEIFLKHGAIIAANLDGGSSTVLVDQDAQIVNKPASEYGERYLPTAWLVFGDPTINIKNVWEGVDPSRIDPSKW